MAEKYDILVLAGQSNAEGFGKGPIDQPYCPSPKILLLNCNKKSQRIEGILHISYDNQAFNISIADENKDGEDKLGNFALSFAQDYIHSGLLQDKRKLLIICSAVGGTGFTHGHWKKDGGQYLQMLKMIDYALGLSQDNRLVAFLWHQGEHDANLGLDSATYHRYLEQMIFAVRQRYNNFCFPFIAGDFVPQWRDNNVLKAQPIVYAQRSICKEISNAAFVESNGLLSNAQKNGGNDTMHFCRQSLYDLGHRYFNAYLGLVGGKLNDS